jgi:hypothetical protein
VFPLSRSNGPDGLMAVADMRAAIDYVAEQRGSRNFEVAHAGNTPGDPARAGAILRPYADIGVTWWLENADLYWLDGWSPEDRRPADAIRARIEQGPPRI